MKKVVHGPSLYYVTDKNIFDALNQNKVDLVTIRKLFLRRNILVGNKTSREELAAYFSRLTHDYYDHKEIASRFGVAARRERITSMDIIGNISVDLLKPSIHKLKNELEVNGDVVHINEQEGNFTVSIQYSTVDYKKSEFTQVQVKDGSIEFIQTDTGTVIRNTHNKYINDIRDSLIKKIEEINDGPLTKLPISLFDIPSPKLRSKFFHGLISSLQDYEHKDVSDMYVYKSKPIQSDDNLDDDEIIEDIEPHIERVFLTGKSVSQSELLNNLLDNQNYYIVKAGWTISETFGTGHLYDIEAVFTDPKDCTGFSFILNSVCPRENGKLSTRKRPPNKEEISIISRVIEEKARDLIEELRQEYIEQSGENGNEISMV